MNAALIGCGLIGERRSANLAGSRLIACADAELPRAQKVAGRFDGCRATSEWRELLDRFDADLLIVATPPHLQASIAHAAIDAGKHVLIEKPAARNAAELLALQRFASEKRVCVRIGFNHRYHPSFRQARTLVDSGALGPLMFLRGRYGHGGRTGYEKEWRADPALSGGGELIDQGVHLIDLARWFLGDFVEIDGFAHTYFWRMPVDDNAFLTLKTATRQVAFLHASWTEWKNTFSFELYGRDGKLHIEGLGGSYGVEKLTWYKMLPQMGPPETKTWEYPEADTSWSAEMAEFLEDIRLGRQSSPGLQDAIAALTVVEKIYSVSGYDHRA